MGRKNPEVFALSTPGPCSSCSGRPTASGEGPSLDQTGRVDGVNCRPPPTHQPCRRWFKSRRPDLKDTQLVMLTRGDLEHGVTAVRVLLESIRGDVGAGDRLRIERIIQVSGHDPNQPDSPLGPEPIGLASLTLPEGM